jgi:hypothetical protein
VRGVVRLVRSAEEENDANVTTAVAAIFNVMNKAKKIE